MHSLLAVCQAVFGIFFFPESHQYVKLPPNIYFLMIIG